MKKILLILMAVLALAVCGCGSTQKISDTRFAMDTFIKIDVYGSGEKSLQRAAGEALQQIQSIAGQTDRFNDGGPGSLYRVNNAPPDTPVKTAPHLAALLAYYNNKQEQEVDITLGGVSDIWQEAKQSGSIPPQDKLAAALKNTGRGSFYYNSKEQTLIRRNAAVQLDLGALAKGYAVEEAARILQADSAVKAALINAGGNIKVIGQKPDGKPWRIAVQHPRDEKKVLGNLILNPGQAAATSGDYQRFYESGGLRWHHLLSPADGRPVRYHQSVTVIADSALEADYNSTLLFLLPDEGINAYLARHPELSAIIVNADGTVWHTANISGSWQPMLQEEK